jgi:hypothetical protein
MQTHFKTVPYNSTYYSQLQMTTINAVQELRKNEIEKLLLPKTVQFLTEKGINVSGLVEAWACCDPSQLDVNRCVERANRLILGDSRFAYSFDGQFQSFCALSAQLAEWNSNKAVCFWNLYPSLPFLKVLRVQSSKTCSMQAAAVLQHYLISIGRYKKTLEVDNIGMLDVSKYEAKSLFGEKLCQYIEGNYSVPAFFFFKQLTRLQDFTTISFSSFIELQHKAPTIYASEKAANDQKCEKMLEFLSSGIPALVHNFRVHYTFKLSSVCSFDRLPPSASDAPEQERFHAMVLVGGMRRDDGSYWFLLQNFWSGKLFVEVSGDYLSEVDAKVSFVDEGKFPTEMPQG